MPEESSYPVSARTYASRQGFPEPGLNSSNPRQPDSGEQLSRSEDGLAVGRDGHPHGFQVKLGIGRNPKRSLQIQGYSTPAETAAKLGISERTLARLIALRQGPPRTMIGRRIYYNDDSILEWLKGQEALQNCRTERRGRVR